jgi:hypothetical protein
MNPSSYSMRDRSSHGPLSTQVGFDATQPIGIAYPGRADIVGERFGGLDAGSYLADSATLAPPVWRRG